MKLTSSLLAEVNRQLDAKKLVVKQGTMVDATIIAAAAKPPPYDEGQVNLRDQDASFTIKNKKTYFGYKAHLAVDEGSDLVRRAQMSSADLRRSQMGEKLIQGDEKVYCGDKAYDGTGLRKSLTDKGHGYQISSIPKNRGL